MGHASIYINTDAVPDDPEEMPLIDTNDCRESGGTNEKEKKELDRKLFGNYIATLDSGKSFGELALLNKDCIRNASIIADEHCLLIVVRRDLYNRCLRTAQEAEFQERIQFVSRNPVFSNWQPRYKRQAAMSLRREKYNFGMTLVHQGDSVNGLIFIVRGQVKVVVDVTSHSSQYPELKLDQYSCAESDDLTDNNGMKRPDKGIPLTSRHWNQTKRRQGYTMAEQRRAMKNMEIALVGPGEIVGDLEKAFDLDTYSKTFMATESTDVYVLDEKNYDRLFSAKRNSKTLEFMDQEACRKVMATIARSLDKQIPLLRCLIQKILDKEKEEEEDPLKNLKDVKKNLAFTNINIAIKRPKSALTTVRSYRNNSGISNDSRRTMKHSKTLSSNKSIASDKTFLSRREESFLQSEDLDHSVATLEPWSGGVTSRTTKIHFYTGKESPNYHEDEQFLDWETSSDHLESLEQRMKSWLQNVHQCSSNPVKRDQDNVVRLHRFVKKNDSRTLHPGKVVLLRKRSHFIGPASEASEASTQPPSESSLEKNCLMTENFNSYIPKGEEEVGKEFAKQSVPRVQKFVPYRGGVPDSDQDRKHQIQPRIRFYEVKSQHDQQIIQKLEAELSRVDSERAQFRAKSARAAYPQSNPPSYRIKSSKSHFSLPEDTKQSNTADLLKTSALRELHIDPTLTAVQYRRFFNHYLRNESRNIEFLNRAREASLRRLARIITPNDYQDPVGYAISSRNSKMLRDILRYHIKPEEIRAYKYVPSVSSRDSRRSSSSLLSVHSGRSNTSVSRKSSTISNPVL